MPTTKNARAITAASNDGDALQFWCVTFSHLVRHQLNRIMSLPHMHTAPPKTLRPEVAYTSLSCATRRPAFPQPTAYNLHPELSP
jgi:hypothetical protein